MGKKEFNFTQGNLSKVVEETLESYRYHLEKKGFVIRTEIASDLPDMIIDEEAMAGVLINLLSNAIKFSPDEKEVTIRLFRTDGTVVLQVADKGIGILKNEIPKIFQRFYRSKNSRGPDSKGSGLGLALVKHVTEAHSGRIQVESELKRGSVFSIFLPVSIPQEELTK
jgi:signal transduction histidine kinase